jgi:hypothetical protein
MMSFLPYLLKFMWSVCLNVYRSRGSYATNFILFLISYATKILYSVEVMKIHEKGGSGNKNLQV